MHACQCTMTEAERTTLVFWSEDLPAMWATLALLTALQLTPAQAGQLRLTNDRATYGKHGATRADNKLLPGDSFVVQFDIENVEVGKDGKVLYSIGLEFLDAKDQVKFKQSPQEMEITNVF